MLAGRFGLPPDTGGWMVEPKWDGIRAVVTVHRGTVTFSSRNDNDVSAAYPELSTPPAVLADRGAVLDGEVVAIADDGRSSFGRLQRRMHVRHPPSQLVREVPVTLVVFDLLWLDGRSLVTAPQVERRRRLDALGIVVHPWMTSPVLDLPADEDLLETGREMGLEGFMVKRLDALYAPGRRSEAWAKVKCTRRREFVVGGWAEGKGGRSGALGSLALGVYDRPRDEARRLVFVGLVGSGLSGADVEAFRRVRRKLARERSPFANPVPAGVRFLEPVLVAEVTFSAVTAAGTLRHPVLEGFRTDLDAAEVVVDAELA